MIIKMPDASDITRIRKGVAVVTGGRVSNNTHRLFRNVRRNYDVRSIITTPGVPTTTTTFPVIGPGTIGNVLTPELNGPRALAINPSTGGVFIANTGDNNLIYIHSVGSGSTIFGYGQFNNPNGIALDSAGNIYVSDTGNNVVKKYPFNDIISPPTVFASGFNTPQGITVDPAGNVYVADVSNNVVKKFNSSGNYLGNVGSGFSTPRDVAIDLGGNIYVADTNNKRIRKISTTGDITTVASGFDWPQSVAVDSSGNLYVAEPTTNTAYRITNGIKTVIGSGFNTPYGIEVDSVGNVYVTDTGNNQIKKITF